MTSPFSYAIANEALTPSPVIRPRVGFVEQVSTLAVSLSHGMMSTKLTRSPFRDHVPLVVCVRSLKEVILTHARTIVAMVQNVQKRCTVGETVGKNLSANGVRQPKRAISRLSLGTNPDPAVTEMRHVGRYWPVLVDVPPKTNISVDGRGAFGMLPEHRELILSGVTRRDVPASPPPHFTILYRDPLTWIAYRRKSVKSFAYGVKLWF